MSLIHDHIATILLSEGRMSLTTLRDRLFVCYGRRMSETALSARCREVKYHTEYDVQAWKNERWIRVKVRAGEQVALTLEGR